MKTNEKLRTLIIVEKILGRALNLKIEINGNGMLNICNQLITEVKGVFIDFQRFSFIKKSFLNFFLIFSGNKNLGSFSDNCDSIPTDASRI